MKEIKILHLFPRLLSLYGEYANLSVLKLYLEKNAYNVSISECEDGIADFIGFDMIYVGSGTEDNIIHGAKALLPQKENVKNSIENGALWLSTGNSLALFGEKIITAENEAYDACGIFNFVTNEEKQRFSGDAMTEGFCGLPLIGYINNSYRFEGITDCFTKLALNATLGNNKKTGEEGCRFNNFYATTLTGPLLAKNPHVTEYFMEKITGEKVTIPEEDNIKKAYKISAAQLKKRQSNN